MNIFEIILLIVFGIPTIIGGILVLYGIISSAFKSDYRWGIIAILSFIILLLLGRYLE
ncbi:MAG: hypothetical protein IKB70_09915 [Bacilli bacterium]|nr:hypothetical protein [Bacilli bacterium]